MTKVKKWSAASARRFFKLHATHARHLSRDCVARNKILELMSEGRGPSWDQLVELTGEEKLKDIMKKLRVNYSATVDTPRQSCELITSFIESHFDYDEEAEGYYWRDYRIWANRGLLLSTTALLNRYGSQKSIDQRFNELGCKMLYSKDEPIACVTPVVKDSKRWSLKMAKEFFLEQIPEGRSDLTRNKVLLLMSQSQGPSWDKLVKLTGKDNLCSIMSSLGVKFCLRGKNPALSFEMVADFIKLYFSYNAQSETYDWAEYELWVKRGLLPTRVAIRKKAGGPEELDAILEELEASLSRWRSHAWWSEKC